MTNLAVYSIFKSIQGESTHTGRPCTFVRLAGCPLDCSYCDTAHVRDAAGRTMEVSAILKEVECLGVGLVEITGGEPLAQQGTPELVTALIESRKEVLVETSGAFPIDALDGRAVVIMDVKPPGSGMSGKLVESNLDLVVDRGVEVKFVLTSRGDFDWAVNLIRGRGIEGKCELLFSPVLGEVEPRDLASWLLDSGVNGRLQLQIHHILWPDGEKEE